MVSLSSEKFPRKKIHFEPHFWPTLLVLIFLVGLILLGFWQLKRYHFKKELLEHYQKVTQLSPIPLKAIQGMKDIRYQPVKIRGHYLNSKSLLLENRFYNDRLGYDVLTPFQVSDTKKIVLVNRGWVPKPAGNIRPNIKSATETLEITGNIQIPEKYTFILGKNILNAKTYPIEVQKIDIAEFASLMNLPFYPFFLHLNLKDPSGFVREWQPITVMPERHMGYAIQWFLLGLTLLLGYFFLSCKRVNKSKNNQEEK